MNKSQRSCSNLPVNENISDNSTGSNCASEKITIKFSYGESTFKFPYLKCSAHCKRPQIGRHKECFYSVLIKNQSTQKQLTKIIITRTSLLTSKVQHMIQNSKMNFNFLSSIFSTTNEKNYPTMEVLTQSELNPTMWTPRKQGVSYVHLGPKLLPNKIQRISP